MVPKSKPSMPLVSVIVPTKNSAPTLRACLQSIADQTYDRIELIVVDNHSTDDTLDIAKQFTKNVYTKGPERSAQRNFAATQASGDYIAFIDSDMELLPDVIAECVACVDDDTQAVIIPEQSFGTGYWAQCKRLERSFYNGRDDIEAARFFAKDVFTQIGGYNADMVSGEDWDLSSRARKITNAARTSAHIRHNEGHLRLGKTLQKKYYYAGLARTYLSANVSGSKLTSQQGPLQRYKLFLSHPVRLMRNPFLGVGVLFMKTAEYAAGAAGYYTKRDLHNV